MKDFKEIIKETEPEGRYRMTARELIQLAQEDDIQAILDAFNYGFAMGVRHERNRQKRQAKQGKA